MNNSLMIILMATIIAFLLGGAAVLGYQKYSSHDFSDRQSSGLPGQDKLFDRLFDDEFFALSRDPFQEMDRLGGHFDDLFKTPGFPSVFDVWFQKSWGHFPAGSIRAREDNDFIYFELDLGEQELKNMQIDTRNGYVTMVAQLARSTGNSTAQTSIQQKFPIPDSADPASVKVEQKDDVVVVRFDKRKTG